MPATPFSGLRFLLWHLEEQISVETNREGPGLDLLIHLFLLQRTGLRPRSWKSWSC